MSLIERDQLILTIIFTIIGFIFILLIISFVFCRLIKYYQMKYEHHQNSFNYFRSNPISIYQQTEYQRSHKYLSNKFNHQTKKRNKRSNTNDSAITLSFNPPHLINQNVKNLEKFYQNKSTLTANSWFYEETLAKKNHHWNPSTLEPVYASSSTVLTSISNPPICPSHLPEKFSQSINEIDQGLCVKHPLKYSQSCRESKENFSHDYYRSISPPSTILSTNNSLEPIYIRTNKPSNATLMRLSRLAQLRDDTAILY